MRRTSGWGRIGIATPLATLVLVLLTAVTSLPAAHAVEFRTVAGTVRDTNGNPVTGVQVVIYALGLFDYTDAAGRYSLIGVPDSQGPYQVQLIAPCRFDQAKDVVVDGDKTRNFTVPVRIVRDRFGNTCRRVEADYIEATTRLPLEGDDATLQIPLPFPFRFYGTTHTSAVVHTNGLVTFTHAEPDFANTPIPLEFTPNNAIYAFWDDLFVDELSGIYTTVVGTAPNRRFVIEWADVEILGEFEARRVTFEIVLSENRRRIVLQYRGTRLFDPSELRTRGGSATVGIENADGTDGIQRSFNQPYLDDLLALEFLAPK